MYSSSSKCFKKSLLKINRVIQQHLNIFQETNTRTKDIADSETYLGIILRFDLETMLQIKFIF